MCYTSKFLVASPSPQRIKIRKPKNPNQENSIFSKTKLAVFFFNETMTLPLILLVNYSLSYN